MRIRWFRSATIIAAFVSVCAMSNAQTDEWLRKSVVELHSRTEVPGAILRSGTYMFRLMDVDDHRKLVQILDREQTRVFATFAAVPDHRLRSESDDSLVLFASNAGRPAVIRTWYWETELNGYEFVYPALRARELIRTVKDYVLTANSFEAEIQALTPDGTTVGIVDAMSSAAMDQVRSAM